MFISLYSLVEDYILWQKVFKKMNIFQNSIVLEYYYLNFIIFSANQTSRSFVNYDIFMLLQKYILTIFKNIFIDIFRHS